jgi:hypothetical protein
VLVLGWPELEVLCVRTVNAAAFLGVAIIGIAALFLTLQSRASRGRRTPEGDS